MDLRGLSFGPERTDYGPKRVDLGPERGLWGIDGWTDVWMDGRTDVWKFTPVSYRTSVL